MYRKVLVPLDGSDLAETILPYVTELALGLKAEVALLAVWNPLALEGRYFPGGAKRMEDRAHGYLDKVTKSLRTAGLKAQPMVVPGFPAAEIVAHARTSHSDLIALSTHGRTGMARGILGSVTDRVIRTTDRPVLTIRPRDAKDQQPKGQKRITRVVVPLDGSPLAEAVLPHVEELAGQLSLNVTLVRIVHIPTLAYGGVVEVYTDVLPVEKQLAQEAQSYLETTAQRFIARNIPVQLEVLRDYAADRIVDFAQASPGSLVAMSTHGRSGLVRFIIGSVTDKVVRAYNGPVLVVRPSQ